LKTYDFPYDGYHRNTVNKYVTALNNMKQDDLFKLAVLVACIGVGAIARDSLLQLIFGDEC
jgi:hypothetical protein